jgi:hypothetical protein
MITCMVVVMIVAPPGEPVAIQGLPCLNRNE